VGIEHGISDWLRALVRAFQVVGIEHGVSDWLRALFRVFQVAELSIESLIGFGPFIEYF